MRQCGVRFEVVRGVNSNVHVMRTERNVRCTFPRVKENRSIRARNLLTDRSATKRDSDSRTAIVHQRTLGNIILNPWTNAIYDCNSKRIHETLFRLMKRIETRFAFSNFFPERMIEESPFSRKDKGTRLPPFKERSPQLVLRLSIFSFSDGWEQERGPRIGSTTLR